jgi:hypothetical protein
MGVFNLDPDSDKDPKRAKNNFLKIWMFFSIGFTNAQNSSMAA